MALAQKGLREQAALADLPVPLGELHRPLNFTDAVRIPNCKHVPSLRTGWAYCSTEPFFETLPVAELENVWMCWIHQQLATSLPGPKI